MVYYIKLSIRLSPVTSQSFKVLDVTINFLLAKDHWENVLKRTILHVILCFTFAGSKKLYALVKAQEQTYWPASL